MYVKKQMTWKRLLALLLIYFVGYLWLIPKLSIMLTLWLDPSATMIRVDVLAFFYVLLIILCVWISWYEWKHSFDQIKKVPIAFLFRVVIGGFFVIILNVFLSVLSSLLSGQMDSLNQEVIADNMSVAPVFMMFSVLIFAPIVEESVFRGGIFAFCRRYLNFGCAAFISALAFGWIHVMDALLAGQWSDGVYLLVYGGIGLVNAWFYERQGGLLASSGVHLFNNLISYLSMLL